MTELPWFKFNPSMWLSGDISCLSYETQGIFISICSRYWKQGCELDQAKLKRRLSIPSDVFDRVIAELEEEGILELIDGNIFISFLSEQHEELNASHARRVVAGSKGGNKRVSNAQAMLKKGLSIKKEDTDTDKEVRVRTPRAKKPKLSKPEWQMQLEGIGCNHVPSKSENWKRIYDLYGIELITKACDETPASKRWDNVIEDYCSKQKPKTQVIQRNSQGKIVF